MKTMTCKQLGGACDKKFRANTFDEIAEISKQHGMEMFQKGDKLHLDAMEKMKTMMQKPASIQEWFETKRKEFDTLEEEENNSITIEALISTDRNKVWGYYTDPKHIINWNFASDDWCCPSVENDLRVGGKYKARMEARDKSYGFDFEAIYDEIVIGNNLTFTISDGRKVNISFEDVNNETRVVVVFEAENENSEDMQRQGWQSILNNFKNYVEGKKDEKRNYTIH